MTAPTPEQIRALAGFLEGIEDALPTTTGVHIIVARDTLRAAADQLEAVQSNVDAYMQKVAARVIDVFENADDDAMSEDVMPKVFAAIGLLQHHGATADTAPQEDRDE